jgi:hypothetical protein
MVKAVMRNLSISFIDDCTNDMPNLTITAAARQAALPTGGLVLGFFGPPTTWHARRPHTLA